MEELRYLTEEDSLRFCQGCLVAIWIMVPVWIFTCLTCMAALAVWGLI